MGDPRRDLLGHVLAVWLAGAGYSWHRAPAIRHRPHPHAGQLLILAAVLATLLVVPAADWQLVSGRAAGVRALGLALLLVGTGFTLWARLTLGAMWSVRALSLAGSANRPTGRAKPRQLRV